MRKQIMTHRALLRNTMKNVFIGKEVLIVYDEYDQDFGLLHERWANKEDRQRLTQEQTMLFGEYIQNLRTLKIDCISVRMRETALKRLEMIEEVMDPEVAEVLRNRVWEK